MTEMGYRQDRLPKKRSLTEKARKALEEIAELIKESEEDDGE